MCVQKFKDMNFAIFMFVLACSSCGITAFYNTALGKHALLHLWGWNSSTINTTILTDGNLNDTCVRISSFSSFRVDIHLQEEYSLRSAHINLKGHPDGFLISYYSDKIIWPYTLEKNCRTDCPRVIDFNIQREGRIIYFYFSLTSEEELCEIELIGCEKNQYGENCDACNSIDNCNICDVNDGTCYVCNESYTGPFCNSSTQNVALQQQIYTYHWGYEQLLLQLLFDGKYSQENCINLDPFLNMSSNYMYFHIYFQRLYNFKDVRFHFELDGASSIILNYTIHDYWNWQTPPISGMEEITTTSTVIIPYLTQTDYLDVSFRLLTTDQKDKYRAGLGYLCEIEIHGCPANHYGTPCRPCTTGCDSCNAVDGSCLCRSGYTGENCTQVCTNNTYGPNCVHTCGNCLNETCHPETGSCLDGCTEGWTTTKCNQECSSGWYGRNCLERCSQHCSTPHVCDRVTGSCIGGCTTGWLGEKCETIDTTYCVDWVPSNVTVLYHNITWKTEEFSEPNHHVIIHDPAVTLVCKFDLKTDEDLYYDVMWYVDEQEVVNHTVDTSNNYTAVLTAYDVLGAHKKIGANVTCRVGAKRDKEKESCLFKDGDVFFYGIKVRNPYIELERKGSKDVELDITIPFASETRIIDNVEQPVSALEIYMNFQNNDQSKCTGGGSSNQCFVQIKGYSFSERHKYETDKWRENISFPVYNKDTDGYVTSTSMTLSLRTGSTEGTGSKIFEDVSLPNISITVRDTNNLWKGRFCSTRTDPHMFTFDRKRYGCHLPGGFIAYRNQNHLQWIQTKHHLCIPSYNGPRCICAVAARAGRDVFVIDLCEGNSVMDFELCEDNVLKVTKIHDKYYKIYFPTGTSLSIYILEWSGHFNIDIEIFPTSNDIENVDGLCGYFDGIRDNDLRWRNSSITDDIDLTYPNEFSNSWRIQEDENLFSGDVEVYDNLESVSTILVPHCSCTEDGKTECSYSSFTPCNTDHGKEYKCNIENKKRRRRRRVSKASPKMDLFQSETRNIDFVQTEEYAETVCVRAFQASADYDLCQDHVADLTNVTLSNCIEDIKMTGDDNLTQIHVEAALQQCTSFVLLNSTLQESDPEITNTVQNLCPNNCSSNGVCKEGNCTCITGYGGSDCSFDLLGPPTISDVPSAGLCDLSTTSCTEATIMGKYFFEKMDSLCYLEIHQVDVTQSTVRNENVKTGLEERTLFEGFCPLHYTMTGVWTTEIKFNISNDDVRFTEKFTIYVYQSFCQEYHNDSGKVFFTLKDNHCYIDNTCVQPMENNSRNICQYCNASNNNYQWTEKQNCRTNETTDIGTTTLTEHSTTTESVQHTTFVPSTDTSHVNNQDYSSAPSVYFSTVKYFLILWIVGLMPFMQLLVTFY